MILNKAKTFYLIIAVVMLFSSCSYGQDPLAAPSIGWVSENIEYPTGCKNVETGSGVLYAYYEQSAIKIDATSGQVIKAVPLQVPNSKNSDVVFLAYDEDFVCYITLTIDSESQLLDSYKYNLYCLNWDGDTVGNSNLNQYFELPDSQTLTPPSDIEFCVSGEIAVSVDKNIYFFDEYGNKIQDVSFEAAVDKLLLNGENELCAYLTSGELCKIIEPNYTISHITKIDVTANDITCGGSGFDFVLYDVNGFYGLSNSGKKELIALWDDVNLSSLEVIQVHLLDQSSLLLDYIDPISNTTQLTLMVRGNKNTDIPTITIAQIGEIDNTLKAYIAACNRRNLGANYQAVLFKDMDELKKEIIAGKGPDIIYSDYDDVSYEVLENIGALRDLYEYIDKDSHLQRNDFTKGYLKCMEKNGQLFSISVGFQLQGLAAKKDRIPNKDNLTMTELLAIAAKMPENSVVSYTTREIFLTEMLECCIENYVDFETNTCDFDNESFRALLILAKEYIAEYFESDTVTDTVDASALLQWFGYYDFNESIQNLSHGLEVVSLPDKHSSYVMMPMGSRFSICYTCQHPDLAWNCIRLMFSDNMQAGYNSGFAYPVIQEAFDEMATQALTRGDISNAQLEIVTENIETSSCRIRNSPVTDIIVEEACAYFSGDKSIDQIISLIDNRVGIYLSE